MTDEAVEWEDVEKGVSELVHVWAHDGDSAWMRLAWSGLAARGLTRYDGTGLDRTRVLVRLLAVGSLYWDFVRVADGESTSFVMDIDDATDALGLDPFFVGQLAGADVYAEADDGRARPALAAYELAVSARRAVREALVDQMGSEYAVFASLWNSRREPLDEDASALDAGTLDAFISADQRAAYEWFSGGCEVLHDPV